MAASLLACGLDPDRCLLFQQSRVHQHTELAWILGCNCPVPSLQRLTQYKEKSEKLKVGLYHHLISVWEDKACLINFFNEFTTTYFPTDLSFVFLFSQCLWGSSYIPSFSQLTFFFTKELSKLNKEKNLVPKF